MTDLMQLALDDLERSHRVAVRALSSRAPEFAAIQQTLDAAVAAGADIRVFAAEGTGHVWVYANTDADTYGATAQALITARMQPNYGPHAIWDSPGGTWTLVLLTRPMPDPARMAELQVAA